MSSQEDEVGQVPVSSEEWQRACSGEPVPEELFARYRSAVGDPASVVHLWHLERLGRQHVGRQCAAAHNDVGRYLDVLERQLRFVANKLRRRAITAEEARQVRWAGGEVGRLPTGASAFPRLIRHMPTTEHEVQAAIVRIADALDAVRPGLRGEMSAYLCKPGVGPRSR